MRKGSLKRLRIFLSALLIALVAADQLSKWLAERYLPFQEAVDIVPFFSLYLTYNTGVAFSMLASFGRWGLVLLTATITLFMIYLWSRVRPEQTLTRIGFALVVAGAVSNLVDRTLFGHVIDYFLFHTENWAFAVFNLADSFITVGAIAIIADELFNWRKTADTEQPKSGGSQHG